MDYVNYGEVFKSLVYIYGNIFSNFTLGAILAQIQLMMAIKTIYIILSMVFPIEGLVNGIFKPFTMLHQMFHAHAAKKINNSHRDEQGRPKQHIRMNVSLGDSSLRNREYTNLSFMISNASDLTIRELSYFANASTAPSFVMILLIISVGPLMQTFWFTLLHFYILTGIILCLMPSKADSKLIFNYVLIKSELSPWYAYNTLLVFIASAGSYAMKYYYEDWYPAYWFVEPLLMGIWTVMCYVVLFAFIVAISDERKLFPDKEKDRKMYYESEEWQEEQGNIKWTPEELDVLNELDSSL